MKFENTELRHIQKKIVVHNGELRKDRDRSTHMKKSRTSVMEQLSEIQNRQYYPKPQIQNV